MQLKELNKKKEKLILKNFKLDKLLKMQKLNMLFNIMNFIIGNLKEKMIILNLILLLLKWILLKQT